MPQASAPGTATTPVREAHRFDQAGLERYLGAHVPEAVPILGASQFAAGQSNPTYLIEGPERRFSQHFLSAQMREIAEIYSSSAGEAR